MVYTSTEPPARTQLQKARSAAKAIPPKTANAHRKTGVSSSINLLHLFKPLPSLFLAIHRHQSALVREAEEAALFFTGFDEGIISDKSMTRIDPAAKRRPRVVRPGTSPRLIPLTSFITPCTTSLRAVMKSNGWGTSRDSSFLNPPCSVSAIFKGANQHCTRDSRCKIQGIRVREHKST